MSVKSLNILQHSFKTLPDFRHAKESFLRSLAQSFRPSNVPRLRRTRSAFSLYITVHEVAKSLDEASKHLIYDI